MLEYYSQHPLYAVLLVALIIVTAFVCVKAAKASARRSRETNKIMNKLKEENKLRNDYAILTNELISSADSVELFKGVAVNLQKRVADKTDMAAEFDSLTKGQKYIYSLYTFLEDSEKEMSNFFKMNTKPLTSTAKEAVGTIVGGEFAAAFNLEYNAYDEDNEKVSVVPEEIEEANKKTAPFIANGTVANLAGEYIKNHPDEFLI